MKTYGKLEDLPKYLKKAQQLDAHIQDAVDKIDHFNEEEVAYGWEQSQYPLRKKVRHEVSHNCNCVDLCMSGTVVLRVKPHEGSSCLALDLQFTLFW